MLNLRPKLLDVSLESFALFRIATSLVLGFSFYLAARHCLRFICLKPVLLIGVTLCSAVIHSPRLGVSFTMFSPPGSIDAPQPMGLLSSVFRGRAESALLFCPSTLFVVFRQLHCLVVGVAPLSHRDLHTLVLSRVALHLERGFKAHISQFSPRLFFKLPPVGFIFGFGFCHCFIITHTDLYHCVVQAFLERHHA